MEARLLAPPNWVRAIDQQDIDLSVSVPLGPRALAIAPLNYCKLGQLFQGWRRLHLLGLGRTHCSAELGASWRPIGLPAWGALSLAVVLALAGRCLVAV